MIEIIPNRERSARIQGAGLSASAARVFLEGLDSVCFERGDNAAASLPQGGERIGRVCRQGRDLLARLPAKSRRNAAEKIAGHTVVHLLADAVWRFFRVHRKQIYDTLTQGRSRALRLQELAWGAAGLLPDINTESAAA